MIARQFKSLLKRFASPTLDALGLYDRQMQKLSAKSWTIVMYHRVIEDAAQDPFSLGMCVTRAHFDQQLAYFRRHFSPIGVAEAVRRLNSGEPLPDRALSITFDDGYLDNYTVALPLLQAHRMEAALYVPTGGLDDAAPLWWDRVIYALDATDAASFVAADFGVPLPGETLSLSRRSRSVSVTRVLDALWTLPHEQVLDAVHQIERKLRPTRLVAPVARRMDAKQVLAMHRAGVEIGAHSVQHSNLALEQPTVVREEMSASKRVLESVCDAPIDGFAYPAGFKNEDAQLAARELGFSYAVCVASGINHLGDDLFSLKRVGMPDTPVADLQRALASVVRRTDAC